MLAIRIASTTRIRFVCANSAMQLPVLPLLAAPLATQPIAWRHGRPVDRTTFVAQVLATAKHLPQASYAINLCEDRYAFLVGFAATTARGATTLLPASRIEAEVALIAARYPDSVRLSDAEVAGALAACVPAAAAEVPAIGAGHVVAIAFTSGSTGAPQPQPKRWGELVAGAALALRRFGLGGPGAGSIVATVPPQHMYGLETSVMLPLASGLGVHAGRPFFPADIGAALAEVAPPRVLVTTPAHLRVCVDAAIAWPALALVISATAPLPRDLARRAEDVFAAPVKEIYGFTEAGSVASRRTVEDELWTLYDGFRIAGDHLIGKHLAAPVALNDEVESVDARRFHLLGRKADVVNVAGKRTSLAFLNRCLCEIQGVEDGVFVADHPIAEESATAGRLAALVVAPGLSRREIIARLALRIDPLFLPRRLLLVEALPRNAVGKLRHDDLRRLLAGPAPTSGGGDGP